MRKYLRLFRRVYYQVVNSIAFFPALISLGFFLCAVIMMYVEYSPPAMALKEKISFLLVADEDTAKAVLTTLVASLISLTVFSFSMVMVVLNTAASNLSPRVLPGLVSQKSHQVVLGFYLGSIIYCLILVINVQKDEQSYQTPTLGVLLAMIFGIVCMALFVYFIDSISNTIQVDKIMNGIFHQTRTRLREAREELKEEKVPLPEVNNWAYINANRAGFFKDVAYGPLNDLLKSHDLKVYVRVTKGFFAVKGFPLLSVSRDLSNEPELEEEILSHFTFFVEEYVKDHHSYGFRQISEIGVKALSPGINDPGTAIRAIDLLSILFIEKIGLSDYNYYCQENGDDDIRLFYREHSFEQLLFEMLTPLRQYGCSDTLLMLNLIEACKNMLFAPELDTHTRKAIARFILSIKEDAEKHISNTLDQQQIEAALENLPEHIMDELNRIKSSK